MYLLTQLRDDRRRWTTNAPFVEFVVKWTHLIVRVMRLIHPDDKVKLILSREFLMTLSGFFPNTKQTIRVAYIWKIAEGLQFCTQRFHNTSKKILLHQVVQFLYNASGDNFQNKH